MSYLIGLLLRLLAYIGPQYSELGDDYDSLPEPVEKIADIPVEVGVEHDDQDYDPHNPPPRSGL